MTDSQAPNLETEIPQLTSRVEEQVLQLFSNIPLSLSVTFVLQMILSISHWKVVGHGDLILWNLIMLVVIFGRGAIWFFWLNPVQDIPATTWINIFRAGAWLGGLAWGSAAYFMFATFNPSYQALLAFTLAGIASGSSTTLSIDRKSVTAFAFLAVAPFSARLYFEHGPVATPMLFMSILFIIFVISSSKRAGRAFDKQFDISTQLFKLSNERAKTQEISKAISKAQSLFISESDHGKAFTQLLEDVLNISQSKFGFIGEVFFDDAHQPYIRMQSLTDISWDQESRSLLEAHKTKPIEFHNLNTLFGAALLSRKPIISNTPAQDMRAGGTPAGHMPLDSFLGIPVLNGDQLVAIVGLANRAKGYDDEMVDYLKPLLAAIAQIIVNIRHQRQHNDVQEKIRQQVQHTETILNEAFDAIITINTQGIITSCNRVAETMFGYSSAQMCGQNVNILMPSSEQEDHDRFLDNYQKTGRKNIIGVGRKLRGKRRNGKEFPMELSVAETTLNQEKAFIGFMRDISEQEKVEHLKNQFIQTVSHELRTPLTSISASLSLLENGMMGKMPDNVKNLIRIAYQNSQRLHRLILDLLDMDKLITNQLTLSPQLVLVHKLIHQSIKENKYIADRTHVTFKVVQCDSEVQAYADENRTLQVLNHLLSNAAKFSPPGECVDISVVTEKDFIKISVSDKGAGIQPEYQNKIFTRFSQADGSATREKEGTGLGLSISKQLIEKMNGRIGFTTVVGRGSTFHIELPSQSPY